MEVESVALSTETSYIQIVVAPASQSQDVIARQEEPELTKDDGRNEIAPRSDVWQHFVKMKDDKDIVRHAKGKYCHRNMKAEAGRHDTSSLKRHLVACIRNPNKFNMKSTHTRSQPFKSASPFEHEICACIFSMMPYTCFNQPSPSSASRSVAPS
jgi:hypothetical protein